MNKSEFRKNAKEKRKYIDINKISSEISINIENFAEFQKSHDVLLFYPKEYEINLIFLCEKYKDKKKFYLPKVKDKNLVVCPYDCKTMLEVSEFNIYEPCSDPVSPQLVDFAIVPCLCADKRGYRIGYGGGFYDRFIPHLKDNCVKISPVAEQFLYDMLPDDKFDYPVDYIVTEKSLYPDT